MTDKKKVTVNINNQDYTVVSVDEEDKYIKKIAKSLDEDIRQILEKNPKLGSTMASVLAAFNMADRFYKCEESMFEMKKDVVEPLKQLDSLKKQVKEYEETEAEVKSECKIKEKIIKEDNEQLKAELDKLKREVEMLSKKNRKNESALEIKDRELASDQKIINDLQDKIFEHQMEIMQSKKQLEESMKRQDDK